jgi:hypothetical protein
VSSVEISPSVRITYLGSPLEHANDVLVEVLNLETKQWAVYVSYNSMSDDYAYTNARNVANALAKTVRRTL